MTLRNFGLTGLVIITTIGFLFSNGVSEADTKTALTQTLRWVIEGLPDTVRLEELKITEKENKGELYLKGFSSPSEGKSGNEQLESFLQNLKQGIPDADLSLTIDGKETEEVESTKFIAIFKWGTTAVEGKNA